MRIPYFMRYYSTFLWAIPLLWAGYSRVTRPSATVHLLIHPEGIFKRLLVRLACVRHAASVRPEPGSNSRSIVISKPVGSHILFAHSRWLFRLLNVLSEFFVCKKTHSNCSVCFNSHFQELTLFIFQCATLSIATAILDYHISRPLSTLFFNFFQLFLLLGIFPTTSFHLTLSCVHFRQ